MGSSPMDSWCTMHVSSNKRQGTKPGWIERVMCDSAWPDGDMGNGVLMSGEDEGPRPEGR